MQQLKVAGKKRTIVHRVAKTVVVVLITMVVVMRTVGMAVVRTTVGKMVEELRKKSNREEMKKMVPQKKMKKMGVLYLQNCPYYSVEISKLPMMSVLCHKICVYLSFLKS